MRSTRSSTLRDRRSMAHEMEISSSIDRHASRRESPLSHLRRSCSRILLVVATRRLRHNPDETHVFRTEPPGPALLPPGHVGSPSLIPPRIEHESGALRHAEMLALGPGINKRCKISIMYHRSYIRLHH
jgi:hypothetical protein